MRVPIRPFGGLLALVSVTLFSSSVQGQSYVSPSNYEQWLETEGALNVKFPRFVPIGDTLLVRVEHVRCRRDLCSNQLLPSPDSAGWFVAPAGSAWMTPEGLFVAREPGPITLKLVLRDTVITDSAMVIPPTAAIEWEPKIEHAFVGDTIRLRAVARSRTGEVSAILPASKLTGDYPRHVVWGGPEGTVIVPETPGTLILWAEAGRRFAKIEIIIEQR